MNEKDKKLTKQASNEVAENTYHPSDYQSTKEVEQGLAIAHEQVSDCYTEGTIDGKINDYEGKEIDLPKGSYAETNVFKEN